MKAGLLILGIIFIVIAASIGYFALFRPMAKESALEEAVVMEEVEIEQSAWPVLEHFMERHEMYDGSTGEHFVTTVVQF